MIRRTIDVVVAALLLLLLAPLLVLIALLVRLRLGRPVLFRQQRPGQDGRPFEMWKFRTMTMGRNERGDLLPDEARLPAFGRYLRASSLDELPELFNILRGDMTFIGPRPLLPEYLPRYSVEQRRRHAVKPGVTGWAQVNGRNDLTWDEKLAMDVWYVDHRSVRLDLVILLKTIGTVLSRRGIARSGLVTTTDFMGSGDSLRREL